MIREAVQKWPAILGTGPRAVRCRDSSCWLPLGPALSPYCSRFRPLPHPSHVLGGEFLSAFQNRSDDRHGRARDPQSPSSRSVSGPRASEDRGSRWNVPCVDLAKARPAPVQGVPSFTEVTLPAAHARASLGWRYAPRRPHQAAPVICPPVGPSPSRAESWSRTSTRRPW